MSPVSVRYIVNDVDAAIPFYTEMLGFTVDMHPAPGFAALSRGDLRLLLNRPGGGGGGGQTLGDRVPEPGGWSRVLIEVDNLDALYQQLGAKGCTFRSEIVNGMGGRQVLVDDPSGNAVELFEPGQAPR